MAPAAGASKALSSLVNRLYGFVPPHVRKRIPGSARKLAVRLFSPTARTDAINLKLWGGFSESAIAELEEIALNADETERAQALLWLAIWHGTIGDLPKGTALLERQAAIGFTYATTPRSVLARVYFHCLQGQGEIARRLLAALPKWQMDDSIRLAWASTYSATAAGAAADADAALGWINAVFDANRLARVARRDTSRPLSLDNIRGIDVPAHKGDEPLISVIVPAYNAADTIETALRSLAEQSWRNIEVVIVDDASSDATVKVAGRFCASDARFRVLRQTTNAGSYAGRNAALVELRGEYITTLDGDDWAHPQRLAVHAADLKRHGDLYNVSNWVRATDDFVFSGSLRPSPVTPLRNMGSFFMHKSVPAKLGGWHDVRIAADTEYMRRAETVFGRLTRDPIARGAPLVFGRIVATSLTRSSATSVATLSHGVRREYHELGEFWHGRYQAGTASLEDLRNWPATDAPPIIQPVRGRTEVDLLVVANWNDAEDAKQGRTTADAAMRQGLSVALFHYPDYADDVRAKISHRLRDFARVNGISFVSAGEAVTAASVIVVSPLVFAHPMDRFPTVAPDRLAILTDEPLSDRVRGNISSLFGRDAQVIVAAEVSDWMSRAQARRST